LNARLRSSVAHFIRKKRTQAGLSQSELARALGYQSPQFISNWERGRSSPPLKIIMHLCEELHVRPAELHELMIEDALFRLEASLRRKFKKFRRRSA
jgi:transcriptional regulator with XRE-family HTH domain